MTCIGQVTYSNEAERKQKVKVTRCLKGQLDDQEITVNGINLLKHFYKKEPGYDVLLFLNKEDSVYKTLAGINGYFKIESGKLIRNKSTVLNTELSDLEIKISVWEKDVLK